MPMEVEEKIGRARQLPMAASGSVGGTLRVPMVAVGAFGGARGTNLGVGGALRMPMQANGGTNRSMMSSGVSGGPCTFDTYRLYTRLVEATGSRGNRITRCCGRHLLLRGKTRCFGHHSLLRNPEGCRRARW